MGNSWIRDEYGPEVAELADQYQAKGIDRRVFMKRLGLSGVGVAAAASILAACGDDEAAAPTTTAAPAEPADSDEAAPATTAAPEPSGPTQGGTLREGYNRDVSKHDPLTTNWYDPAFFAIYEAILSNDPSGATVPQFASGFSVSDDGLTYTFDIPEGKLSHSGGTVDAEMVAEFYRSVQAFSFIAGLAAPVDTYEADGNTVIMKMKNAWLGALGPHKTGYWRILNINTWKDSSLNADGSLNPESSYGTEFADGTGPFTHEEWVPGSHVLVNRWADYPGSNTPFFENKGPAHLDAIRWTIITEEGQRATQLENGDIDTLINPAHIDISRLENNPDLTVIRHPEWSGFHLAMNRDYDELFGDVLTRQGLSHSLDREGMVNAILAGNGAATYGPFPTTDRQYDPRGGAVQPVRRGSGQPETRRGRLGDGRRRRAGARRQPLRVPLPGRGRVGAEERGRRGVGPVRQGRCEGQPQRRRPGPGLHGAEPAGARLGGDVAVLLAVAHPPRCAHPVRLVGHHSGAELLARGRAPHRRRHLGVAAVGYRG